MTLYFRAGNERVVSGDAVAGRTTAPGGIDMGRGDNRRSMKMRRRISQRKTKARRKAKAGARAATPAATPPDPVAVQ